MRKSFTAQLKQWQKETERKGRAVLRQSVQDVLDDAQTPVAKGGSLPVDQGFLRNSLATEVNGTKLAEGADTYTLAIAQLEPGDKFRAGWTADYALVRHYKPPTFGQGGGLWRDKAAGKWQSFVDENARKVRNK